MSQPVVKRTNHKAKGYLCLSVTKCFQAMQSLGDLKISVVSSIRNRQV